MGSSAFEGCSSVTTLMIGNNVQTIPNSAFAYCSGLTSVTIPNSVTTIGNGAFIYCARLTEIYVKAENPPMLGNNVFSNNVATISVHVPCGKETTYQSVSGWKNFSNIIGDVSPLDISVQSNNGLMGIANIIQYNTCTNDTAIIEAVANAGYHFVQWQDGDTNNPRNITVTKDTVFVASFTPNIYHVTVFANNAAMGSVSGGGNYYNNSTVGIEAIPNIGYRFVQWNDSSTANPRTITVIEDTTFTAIFVADGRMYSVTVSANNPTMGSVNGSENCAVNTNVTITATPNTGYRFAQWNDGNTDNPRNIRVIQDTSFTAIFYVYYQQPFPDGGFENCWKWYTNHTLGKAAYWDFNENYFLSTLNELHELEGNMGDAPLTAFRLEGNDAYEGNYSLKLVSNPMALGGSSFFLPGVAATRSLSLQFFPNWDCILGESFASRPIGITGYYKYAPVNGDSAAIEVCLKRNGTELGRGKQVITSTISNWTMFNIPITYTSNGTPDSIVVIFASSAKYDLTGGFLGYLPQCEGQAGSALCLDKIEFDYGIGTYHVTVTANNTTMGSVTGSGDYAADSLINITATPGIGYRFAGWNDGNTDNPRNIRVTQDTTFVATFALSAPNTYHVSISANNSAMGSVSGDGDYALNSNVTISATASTNHRFVKWQDGSTQNPRTITLTQDTIFTAEFEAAMHYVFLFSNTATRGSVSGNGQYIKNSPVNIEAIPYVGYRFVQWQDGDTNNRRTITVTQDTAFMALFGIEGMKYIYVIDNDTNMGNVLGGGDYATDSIAVILAIPEAGHRFVEWQDMNTDNPRTIVVRRDETYIAKFEAIRYHVTVSVNEANMGRVTGDGDYAVNATATIEAIPNAGYRFIQWNDNITQNPRTITVTSNMTFTAIFDVETGIKDISTSAIHIYPNPAMENIHITLPENVQQGIFTLYDMQGKMLMKQEIGKEEIISVGYLSSGMYIYKITTDKQNHQGKMIIKN
jgi:hypothetical protein